MILCMDSNYYCVGHIYKMPLYSLPTNLITFHQNALGENIPSADTTMSSAHCVYIDSIIKKAGDCVNGTTITSGTQNIDYIYHLDINWINNDFARVFFAIGNNMAIDVWGNNHLYKKIYEKYRV